MSLTTEERQRLWHLFQACDTDSDGLVNCEDIRLLSSRSELSDYHPEEIVDLFAMRDDSNLTFEDFVQHKLAHHHHHSAERMSETTSMSSSFTNPSSDVESIPEPYEKLLYERSTGKNNFVEYDSNLNKFKSDLILHGGDEDDDCSLLSKNLNNLQLDSDSNYHAATVARRVFTALPVIKNQMAKYRGEKFSELKCFKNHHLILPEDIERFNLSEDIKKKFELIRQDYFKCLNELSEENENICEELDRALKERNYLRENIDLLRDEYTENLQKHREQWLCERQKLEQKINSLEAYIAKLSAYPPKPWMNHFSSILDNPDIINDNDPDKYIYSENFKLHQLANKISELALFLSEIISNLRKSEVELLVANCRVGGIGSNAKLIREEEEDEIMGQYELAMLNRTMAERESIDFIRNLDKGILVQYLTPGDFQKLFNTNRQLSFDLEFQNILIDLLAKLKDDLRNVNKTLDQQQIKQCEKFSLEDTYQNYIQEFGYPLK